MPLDRHPDVLRQFLEDYQRYSVEVLTPTLREIRVLFNEWHSTDFWGLKTPDRRPAPSPINHRWSRIKRPESVVDKIIRRAENFPHGLRIESARQMYDAVAGRVAVYFLGNLPLIDHAIHDNPSLEISTTYAPVAYLPMDTFTRLALQGVRHGEKESGYCSIHYILRFRDSTVAPSDRPWWELQVRTLAEHVWAELHHILGYKPNKRTYFAVRKQFQIVGAHIHAIDEHFNLLYEELGRFQNEGKFAEDDPLNAENLSFVLSELGVGCAQNQIDGLLRLLHSRKVDKVSTLRAVGMPLNVERIRNAFKQHTGRAANNFDIVACLAAIKDCATDSEITDAIHLQADFLESWEMLTQLMRSTPRPPADAA